MSYHKRTTCRLCDSRSLSLALHYPPQPLADEYLRKPQPQPSYPLDLYLCDDCGCAQLLDVVSADEIYPRYTYETGSSPALVEHFRQYADEVNQRIRPAPGSLIVDLGSNDGTLLRFFPSFRGLRRLGVDPAPVSSPGISTIKAFFDAEVSAEILRQHGPASIVTANNVYANIDDLRSFTENVRNLLTYDGVFVFETFYLGDLIDNVVFDFIYHEHLTAFALSPLIGFFQRVGMQIFDVQHAPTKGGSIRVYVQLDSGKRPPVSLDVATLVNKEYHSGLHKRETFIAYRARIDEADAALWNYLDSLKPGTFSGYGASPTSTTLIYSWELGKFLNYLVDDWPGKIGTYSPGLHLPVYSREVFMSTDYCIILAWRYAEQIMANNPLYRGTWIIPLPELKIIKGEDLIKMRLGEVHRLIDGPPPVIP